MEEVGREPGAFALAPCPTNAQVQARKRRKPQRPARPLNSSQALPGSGTGAIGAKGVVPSPRVKVPPASSDIRAGS